MNSQTCRVCGVEKALSEFTIRKETGKYRTECKPCRSSGSAAKRYNVTVGFIESLKESQGSRCAICGIHESVIEHVTFKHNPLVIDHDHFSGAVRGLLCPNCNSMIGQAKDNPQILANAISYLLKHTSNTNL